MTNDRHRDLLVACGEALYGPRWQTNLASDLGIDDRTMRRWVSGDSPVPAGVWVDLIRLMRERAHRFDDLVEACRRVG